MSFQTRSEERLISEHKNHCLHEVTITVKTKSQLIAGTFLMIDLTMALFARVHANGRSWKNITSLFS